VLFELYAADVSTVFYCSASSEVVNTLASTTKALASTACVIVFVNCKSGILYEPPTAHWLGTGSDAAFIRTHYTAAAHCTQHCSLVCVSCNYVFHSCCKLMTLVLLVAAAAAVVAAAVAAQPLAVSQTHPV
jgi:hypothetical protein